MFLNSKVKIFFYILSFIFNKLNFLKSCIHFYYFIYILNYKKA